MPLVRIDLMEGKSAEYRKAVGDAIHQALVEVAKVPIDDRFQLITEHKENDFIFDTQYLYMQRTKNLVMIQITLNHGRNLEVKKELYARIADLLHAKVNLKKEDVLISLLEVTKENWSFGNGVAQYT